ncbi:MAG TPA: hypothetical protein VMV69_24245, partial [Pirellulales bacterium]|nr:hypothetical protein [Pirellulales bacterium]
AGDETRPANMFNLPASTRSRGSLPRGYPGMKLAGRKTCVKTEFSTPYVDTHPVGGTWEGLSRPSLRRAQRIAGTSLFFLWNA